MFVVVYQWRVAPEAEQRFVEAWAALTEVFREEHGGLGSRLHRGADGLWFAYAQWPSESHWQRRSALSPRGRRLLDALNAVAESAAAPLPGTVVKDLL